MPQSFAQWKVGDIILDLYKVIDILGEGGFGRVYKVRHQSWNIDLAVKIPKPEIVEAAGGVENFEREAEAWVNLGLHPHTVSCYYVRRIDRSPVVFAEYIAGGSLSDWIYSRRLYARETEISLKRILNIAIQFAWGLHYAHEQGLIHQDVKPANVMLTAEGIVKVTDFGLANALTATAVADNQKREPQANRVADSTLMVAGSGAMTPAYCSPEQANGNNLTRRTDLWSWALCVLEMFQGELTWGHGTVAAGALEYYLESSSEYLQLPQMPILFAQLLRRCFLENPDERPHNMLEVANELQSIYQEVTREAYPQQQPQTGKDIADSLNNRAVSLFDLGKQQEALQLWKQALQIQPQHPESTYNRSLILWRAAEINDDAIVAEIEESQRLYVGNWIISYLLSLVHLERDDCEAAIQLLENIQVLGVQNSEVEALLTLAKERLPYSTRLIKIFDDQNIVAGSLSANSRFAVFANRNHTLNLYNVFTGTCLRTLKKKSPTIVCLSADGLFALFRSVDNTLTLWDVDRDSCLVAFEENVGCGNSIYLSANNRLVLCGSLDNTLKLWKVHTGHCLRTFEGHKDHYAQSVCLSADDRFALSASQGEMKLWEVATGRCLCTFEVEEYADYIQSVCLSADGRFALSGATKMRLWEVRTGRCLRIFKGHKVQLQSVCLSTDSRFALSVGLDGNCKLWAVGTGRCLRTFKKDKLNMDSISLSADNRFALLMGLGTNPELWSIGCLNNFFTAPLKLSAVIATETVLLSDTAYRRKLQQAQKALEKNDYTSAALHIQEARNQSGYSHRMEAVNVWTSLYLHLPRKALQGIWESRTFTKGHSDYVQSVCLSPDNRFAIFGCSGETGGTLKLWEIATEKYLPTFEGHTSCVYSVSVSADSSLALSGSADNTLKLWKIATGHCLRTFKGHQKPVTTVCLSADSSLALSGSEDNTLKLWEISTGHCLRTFKGHQKLVTTVCLSADSSLALSGSEDNTLRLWEISTGRCLRIFEGHKDGVKSVCLSGDNRLAMSVSKGFHDSLKVWEISTGSCLYSFSTNAKNLLCLSADSRFALCSSPWDDFTMWILDWELELQNSADWDEGARPYLDNFLTLHIPYATTLPENRKPSNKEIILALTRCGTSTWTEKDFQNLMYTLGCAGYGWLSPQIVHHQLKVMATRLKLIKRNTTTPNFILLILLSLYVQTRDIFKPNFIKICTIFILKASVFCKTIVFKKLILCILILSLCFLPSLLPTSPFLNIIIMGIIFAVYAMIVHLTKSA